MIFKTVSFNDKKIIKSILVILSLYFLLTHINIWWGYSSLDKQYKWVNRVLFMVNETVIDYFWWKEDIYGWWRQRFTKKEDQQWIVFYVTNAWGFLEIVSSIVYNPLNADISQECILKEVLTCKCYKAIWRCEIIWSY
jgi:hypothetical protein